MTKFREVIIAFILFSTLASHAAVVSRIKTWTNGETLTASDLNAEFDNLINAGFTPQGINDYSNSVSQMQETANPGTVGGESLSTTLADELKQIRYMLKWITGATQWYDRAGSTVASGLLVTTANITDGTIATADIGNAQVTAAKMAATNNGFIGEIRMFHTFNGAVSIPRGWMKCNGDQVTLANYEAIHGAGAWATDGIGTAALNNKYLPNMIDKYPVGKATTTQNGSVTITAVGNASNQVNLTHTHTTDAATVPAWHVATAPNYSFYNSSGVQTRIDSAVSTASGRTGFVVADAAAANAAISGAGVFIAGAYIDAFTTGSGGSATQSIQPASIEVIYIIKVN